MLTSVSAVSWKSHPITADGILIFSVRNQEQWNLWDRQPGQKVWLDVENTIIIILLLSIFIPISYCYMYFTDSTDIVNLKFL